MAGAAEFRPPPRNRNTDQIEDEKEDENEEEQNNKQQARKNGFTFFPVER